MKRLLPLALIPILVVWLAAPRPAAQPGDWDLPTLAPMFTASASGLRTGAPLVAVSPGSVPRATPAAIAATPTPRPTAVIDDAGAAYFKPTPKPQPRIVDGISGQASWWNTFGGGFYVALRPDLGSKGDLVIVCGGEPFHCVTAPVITSCACLGPNSERLVDLSRDLFAEFADPSLGVVRITLQVVGR